MKFDFDEDINIDLTPLIDVIFMLLIFFIMTTTFSKPVIDIMLPASKTAEKAGSETKEIVITVSNKGDIYYGENIISANELEKILKDNPDKIELVNLKTHPTIKITKEINNAELNINPFEIFNNFLQDRISHQVTK